MFWNLSIIYKTFLSQQVNRNVVVTNKNGKYELTDELPNQDLRKSQNSIEL